MVEIDYQIYGILISIGSKMCLINFLGIKPILLWDANHLMCQMYAQKLHVICTSNFLICIKTARHTFSILIWSTKTACFLHWKNWMYMFCMETARFAQLKKNRMAIFSKIYMKTIHKLYGIVWKLYENYINRFHRVGFSHLSKQRN